MKWIIWTLSVEFRLGRALKQHWSFGGPGIGCWNCPAFSGSLSNFQYHWPWCPSGLAPGVGSGSSKLLFCIGSLFFLVTGFNWRGWVRRGWALGHCKRGILQGSGLSPLLFNIYKNCFVRSSNGTGYDDNTHLYLSILGQADDTVVVLSECLETVSVWMGMNQL